MTDSGIHIGAAVYNDNRFPFAEHSAPYPPLTGTIKIKIHAGNAESAYVNIDSLQQPWSKLIAPKFSENSRKNYAALLKALRKKLRSLGEDIAKE